MARESARRYSEGELLDWSKRTGRSTRTLYRWIKEGCVLEDPASLGRFLREKEFLKPPIQKLRELKRTGGTYPFESQAPSEPVVTNGELPPAGQKGAQHALARLEAQEEEAHRRLQSALERGNVYQIEKAQEFWLKCSETLRRLDLAVEIARRQEEKQVPLKVAEGAILAAAEWMRIAFTTFWSSEGTAILGIKSVGELKAYSFERFKGILDLTVRAADKTASPVPDWAKQRIREAWNVQDK